MKIGRHQTISREAATAGNCLLVEHLRSFIHLFLLRASVRVILAGFARVLSRAARGVHIVSIESCIHNK
jgi:hypothetical protein